jgi:hypothetical protein
MKKENKEKKGERVVTTTQVAKLRKKKGVETILVDYK